MHYNLDDKRNSRSAMCGSLLLCRRGFLVEWRRRPPPRPLGRPRRPWFSEEPPSADNEFISAFPSFAAERAKGRKEMSEIKAGVLPSLSPHIASNNMRSKRGHNRRRGGRFVK